MRDNLKPIHKTDSYMPSTIRSIVKNVPSGSYVTNGMYSFNDCNLIIMQNGGYYYVYVVAGQKVYQASCYGVTDLKTLLASIIGEKATQKYIITTTVDAASETEAIVEAKKGNTSFTAKVQ